MGEYPRRGTSERQGADRRMNEWCVDQHGKSGLTAACLASEHTYPAVAQAVLEYIQKWIPERGAGLLAGSSVHADMRWVYNTHCAQPAAMGAGLNVPLNSSDDRFLLVGMPEVMKHLSYRILGEWYPS